MNIDELEKLARAAHHGVDWFITPELEEGTPMFNEDARFIYAANPAAILELISINRELVAAIENLLIVNVTSDNSYNKAVKALTRANGESND